MELNHFIPNKNALFNSATFSQNWCNHQDLNTYVNHLNRK
jgi:hypothetical protein